MAFMTAIATVLSPYASVFGIAGTVASTVAGISAANAQAQAAEYNARVADRDAFVAEQNRQLTLEQTNKDVADKRRENRRVLSSIRAAYGASGVELAGSPLDVIMDTAVEQELDVARTETEGLVRGRELTLQMFGLQESANLSRAEARSARRSRVGTAIGTLAGGLGTQLSQVA